MFWFIHGDGSQVFHGEMGGSLKPGMLFKLGSLPLAISEHNHLPCGHFNVGAEPWLEWASPAGLLGTAAARTTASGHPMKGAARCLL